MFKKSKTNDNFSWAIILILNHQMMLPLLPTKINFVLGWNFVVVEGNLMLQFLQKKKRDFTLIQNMIVFFIYLAVCYLRQNDNKRKIK